MDLELGLKLRRVADEFCLADFQFYKDRTGPVFISTETDSKFFLTAHPKGMLILPHLNLFFSSGC